MQYSRAISRSLRNGTTTCCYFATLHEAASVELARLCVQAGQRALVGKVCMDRNAPDAYCERSAAASLLAATNVADRIAALGSPLVEAIVTPRFAPTCTPELLAGLGKLARERSLAVQSHVRFGGPRVLPFELTRLVPQGSSAACIR